MENNESTGGGFLVGVLLTTIATCFYPNSVDLDNLVEVHKTIGKCTNGEYVSITLYTKAGSWEHGATEVRCKDGTYLERTHNGNN